MDKTRVSILSFLFNSSSETGDRRRKYDRQGVEGRLRSAPRALFLSVPLGLNTPPRLTKRLLFRLVVQSTVAPPTIKGIKMETSLPFGSENLCRKAFLIFPETTRLYSQREQAAPKIIPSAATVATKLFLWKAPEKMGNSPIKLLVPGELILAKVKKRKMVERLGMVLTKPP